MVDYRAEHRYTHDTLIGGLPAQVIQVHNFGTGTGGVTVDAYYFEYTRSDGDVVLAGQDSTSWDTLYWFGEIGDRWWPIGAPMGCPPEGMIEITDTGSVVLGGLQLRTWGLAYLDDLGQPSGSMYSITERIGGVPRVPFIFDCSIVIEYFFPHFICYSDSDLFNATTEPCAIDLGVPNIRDGCPSLSISPVPARDAAWLTVDDRWIGSELRVLDMTGRIVMRATITGREMELDLSYWKPGLYEVLLLERSGTLERASLVKL